MSDVNSAAAGATSGTKSAGAMLREARQAKGLHIAALSASIKVSQRKLELLEADKVSELPDATFARALAQTVCRSLKIDPVPVLAALPQAPTYRLEGVDEGINTPFRDRPGRHEPDDLSILSSPAVWAPALIVIAALVVYLMPSDWVTNLQTAISAQPTPESVVEVLPADGIAPVDPLLVEPVAAASSVALSDAAAVAVADPASAVLAIENPLPASDFAVGSVAAAPALAVGPLHVKAAEASWVEVVDARSRVLMSRMLQPGETVVLDGEMPLRLKVGNAAGTSVEFRGQAVDLATATRDNVARLELK